MASDSRLLRCVSIEDIRGLARKRMPLPFFDLIDGGSGDEVTMRRNIEAFEEISLYPRLAQDVREVDTTTDVFDCKLSFPLILAPTGAQAMVHPDGEIAPAKAASRAGIMYALSTFAATGIEALAQSCKGLKMFQLYALNDRYVTTEMIDRAKSAGYDALCLTIDSPVNAGLERVDRWGLNAAMGRPPAGTVIEIVRKPAWLWKQRAMFAQRLPDVARRILDRGGVVDAEFFNTIIRKDLRWSDVEEIARRWDGPFAVKGVLRADDAAKAVDSGATAVVVCNHGGTQLDGTPPSISVLEKIVERVGKSAQVIQSGGVRRGSSMVKALGLGAHAVMVGRPFLYGLGAAGEDGVGRVLEILHREFETTVKLCGISRLSDLSSVMSFG